ncbi:mitochondrial division protein 1 [Striga asiatica]|uniref:Mitochondrial division protein 1 n=1 Tax=Striga asiatica TaxID=4170 RepID=A0A5A7R8H1_STRAF|nr:mitochondrial division protein 1 [Striga asiatica]
MVSRFGTSILMLRPSILSKSHNTKCLSPGDASSLTLTFLNFQQRLRTRHLSKGQPNIFVSKVPPSTWTCLRVSLRKLLNRTLSTGLSLHLHRCISSRDSAKNTAEGRAVIIGIHLSRRKMTGRETGLHKSRRSLCMERLEVGGGGVDGDKVLLCSIEQYFEESRLGRVDPLWRHGLQRMRERVRVIKEGYKAGNLKSVKPKIYNGCHNAFTSNFAEDNCDVSRPHNAKVRGGDVGTGLDSNTHDLKETFQKTPLPSNIDVLGGQHKSLLKKIMPLNESLAMVVYHPQEL